MKVNFLFSVAALCLVGLGAAEKPDLTGFVLEPDGRAVTNASVFIYTAGPRVGSGYI
jgi:hypothetical protein